MFNNKSKKLINTVLIAGIMATVSVSSYAFSVMKTNNSHDQNLKMRLTNSGDIFAPPDEGKPDPVNTAGIMAG